MGRVPKGVIKSSERGAHSFRFRHPLGEGGSEVLMTMLARPAGLKRLGVNLGRVPPGKEAFVYHRHHAEEEWVFILEGEALCDIENETMHVAAGDFIAYPAGVAHNLKNVGEDDLVYLMGGEQIAVEVADFPRHGKRLLRTGEIHAFVDANAAEPFAPDIEPVKPTDKTR